MCATKISQRPYGNFIVSTSRLCVLNAHDVVRIITRAPSADTHNIIIVSMHTITYIHARRIAAEWFAKCVLYPSELTLRRQPPMCVCSDIMLLRHVIGDSPIHVVSRAITWQHNRRAQEYCFPQDVQSNSICIGAAVPRPRTTTPCSQTTTVIRIPSVYCNN